MTRRAVGAAAIGALVALSVFGLSACGTTIVEDATPTSEPAGSAVPATTVPLPTSAGDRLTEIVALTTGLGNLIADGGDRAVLDRIDALWAASSSEVGDLEPALGREIVHQLELLHLGVDRNRPAEADKATQNLTAVLEAYLARHSG